MGLAKALNEHAEGAPDEVAAEDRQASRQTGRTSEDTARAVINAGFRLIWRVLWPALKFLFWAICAIIIGAICYGEPWVPVGVVALFAIALLTCWLEGSISFTPANAEHRPVGRIFYFSNDVIKSDKGHSE